MYQLPHSLGEKAPELNFFKDWEKSIGVTIQAVMARPVPAICCALLILAQIFLAAIPGWGLLQAVAMLYLVSSIIQATYSSIVPESLGRPELFPYRPEMRMLGINILVGMGAWFGFWFFIFPAFWMVIVHFLALPATVLEGTGVMDSMARSRELMKGNGMRVWKYAMLWPFVITCAVVMVALVGTIIVAFMGGAFFQSEAGREVLKNVIITVLLLFFSALNLTFQPLATRAFIQLTHESGRRTAIEEKLSRGAIEG